MAIPAFDSDGLLPAGIHSATWEEFSTRYGLSAHRNTLLEGLRAVLLSLKEAGGHRAYINGSFVSAKEHPNDFDGCWDEQDVDGDKLHPALLIFDDKRALQKALFGGEMFPSSLVADHKGTSFVTFFQKQRDTGAPKGIVCIDLREWNP